MRARRTSVKFSPEDVRRLQRRIDQGETVATLARELGLSRQRVHQLLSRANPTGEPRSYTCSECRETWQSTAMDEPERCGVCGAYDWR